MAGFNSKYDTADQRINTLKIRSEDILNKEKEEGKYREIMQNKIQTETIN